jgi:glutathione peroxidase
MEKSIYQFSATSLAGREVKMESYRGKTLLVVNTASKCGFTPQLEGLEKLFEKFRDKGFIILGFPCNQFGNQEPGDEKSIEEGCVINYGVTFPMFSKIEVNGKNAHPIYKYLKSKLKGLLGGTITWNFTKFLIDAGGKPVKRFAPSTTPEEIDRFLSSMLN